MRHHWAVVPPATASLDVEDLHNYIPRPECNDLIVLSDGLCKLESIMLETPPELSSAVFMQLVGNPKAEASNLTTLDLRFCPVDHPTIAQLLYHAPPNLKRLSLLLRPGSVLLQDHRNRSALPRSNIHLCPLIRQYSKRLERLDYGARKICRHLFFDEDEIFAMRENGINTKIGEPGRGEVEAKRIDKHAIEQTIRTARQQRRAKERDERIRKAVHESDLSTNELDPQYSLEMSARTGAAKYKAQRDMEALLDEEEAQRHRLINGSSTKWTRRIIALGELCEAGDTWAEMKLAADMEERGVQWVLASTSTSLLCFHLINLAEHFIRKVAPSCELA